MDRDEFLDMLARLAERYDDTDGRVGVSEAEARRLLSLYDDGEIREENLPLPVAIAVASRRTQLVLEVARQAGADLRRLTREVIAGEIGEEAAESFSEEAVTRAARQIQTELSATDAASGGARETVDIDTRRRFVVTVLEDFDGDVYDDARAVTRGNLPARDWHERMLGRIRRDLLQQARLGKGRPLTAGELADLQDAMDEQARYLKRFADEVSARNELADNAEEAARRQLREEGKEVTEEAVQELAENFRSRRMTTDQVAARARMYKGKGYETFWRKSEENVGSDIVVDYIAVDDAATCGPCQAAEAAGPYLPGQGPMPGSVCLGRGHCRCRRERRRAPEVAAQLRGE